MGCIDIQTRIGIRVTLVHALGETEKWCPWKDKENNVFGGDGEFVNFTIVSYGTVKEL